MARAALVMLACLACVPVGTATGATGFEICALASSCQAGSAGGLGGELSEPAGVAVGGAGNVYVADKGNGRVQEFDDEGSFVRAWGRDVVAGGGTGFEVCEAAAECKAGIGGESGGELTGPTGVAVGPGGQVYVADTGGNRIQEFDSVGNFVRAWGRDVVAGGGTGFEVCEAAAECKAGVEGALGGELAAPADIAVGAGGATYVVDLLNNRVQVFDDEGDFVRAWGKEVVSEGAGFEICELAEECRQGGAGGGDGEFNGAWGIGVDSVGRVYVADTLNHRGQLFEPSGSFLAMAGKDVLGPGEVVSSEVCLFPEAESCQAGSAGGFGGELAMPFDLAADDTSNVYVSDTGNFRLQQGNYLTGEFIRAWGRDVVAGGGTGFEACTLESSCKVGAPGVLGGEFFAPVGIALSPAGDVLVTDPLAHRVQEFGPSGGFVRAWGKDVVSDEGSGTPPGESPGPPGESPGVTPTPTPLPPPRYGKTVNAAPVRGRVRIRVRGSKRYRLLTAGAQIPIGSIVDTTHGRVRLTSAKTIGGATQTAVFYAGTFKVLQGSKGKPTTLLKLVANFAVDRVKHRNRGLYRRAEKRGGKKHGGRKRRRRNGLWGKGHGNYVTKGKYGSAAVRGTVWFTQNRPDGTFFKVKRGVVRVTDFAKHRKLKLRAGRHYLARPR